MIKNGVGPGKTREDHYDVFMQLFAAYSKGQYLRELSVIVGSEALAEADKKFLNFANEFERKFMNQGRFERRTIEQTLDLAWDIMGLLPESELKLAKEQFIKKYYPTGRAKNVDPSNQISTDKS